MPPVPSVVSGKTKGQVEAAITEALTRFERDYLGRGPREAQSFIFDDMVVVRLKGILSPAERQLSDEPDGVEMIKQMRARLVESCSDDIEALVEEELGVTVVSMHTDISAQTGERVFLFTMEENVAAFFDER
jgi:uncharacterized protein YbcI